MAQYMSNGEMIEDTPVWDQKGNGQGKDRRCVDCRIKIHVIGARAGKAYRCPPCDAKLTERQNRR